MDPFECFNNPHYSALLGGEVALLPTLSAYPSKRAAWRWSEPPRTPGAALWARARRCSLGALARLDRVVVIDADSDAAAARVSEALNRLGAATMQVKTSRGMHFYLRADGAHNQTLAGGIDVKTGRRSYVIAPGSMHPSGHVYAFANDAPPAALNRGDFYRLLNALGARLERAPERVPDVPDVPERVPVGERNTTLFALAQRMSTDALLGAEGAQLRAAAMGWGLTAAEVSDVVGRVVKSRIGYTPSSAITRTLGTRSSVDAVYAALQRIARRTRGKTFRASQRDVAVNARLSRNTVARALRELQQRGLLEQLEPGGRGGTPARWRLLQLGAARTMVDEGDAARDMDVTGQRALAWARQQRGEWTARDMAQALGFTESTARRQISRLAALGFCAPAPTARKQGRGRPAGRYVSAVSREGSARLEQRAAARRQFLASTYRSDRARWADELTARALKRAERAARQLRLLGEEHPNARIVVAAQEGVFECTPHSVGVERLLGAARATVTLVDWGVVWHVAQGALVQLELLSRPAQLALLR